MVEVGDVSVVVGHLSAPPPEKLNYVERRGLPDVINVALVSNPAHENLRALHRPAPVVERIGHLDRNEFGHGRVTSSASWMKRALYFRVLSFQERYRGSDRNAVPAQTGAGIEGHETEWLAGRGVDDLPGIQSKADCTSWRPRLTRPMLTARKVFSNSLTISAVSDDDTGMIRSMNGRYSATAASSPCGLVEPMTLGVLRVWNFGLPGSTRSGEKAREVLVDLEPGRRQLGQQHLTG